MYQAIQNVLFGFGSICGASLGGFIADTIGWRWCFLFQVPISLFALVFGYYTIIDRKPQDLIVEGNAIQVEKRSIWRQIDLSGSVLLVLGLASQLAALSMGGNDFDWISWQVIVSLLVSIVLLTGFVIVEIRTGAIPIMPMSMFKGLLAISNIISNVCSGMAAYGVCMPLLDRTRLKNIVPVHDPSIFPSRPRRYSITSWTSTGDSFLSNTCRRSDCGLRDVSLGSAQQPRQNRLPHHGNWQCIGGSTEIRR